MVPPPPPLSGLGAKGPSALSNELLAFISFIFKSSLHIRESNSLWYIVDNFLQLVTRLCLWCVLWCKLTKLSFYFVHILKSKRKVFPVPMLESNLAHVFSSICVSFLHPDLKSTQRLFLYTVWDLNPFESSNPWMHYVSPFI